MGSTPASTAPTCTRSVPARPRASRARRVHHNPKGVAHGGHAGDLPNLVANGEGRGRLNAHLDGFTLTAGDTTLFDGDGTALIIHAGPDDDVTDPTGNSGGRVACAVITAG